MSLKDRRERGDLIEAFKTLSGFNNVNKADWFEIPEPDQTRQNTRSTTSIGDDGHKSNRTIVLRERPRTEPRNHSFRLRVARARSLLPDNVRNAKSVNALKNSYDSWKQQTHTPTNSLVSRQSPSWKRLGILWRFIITTIMLQMMTGDHFVLRLK